MQYQNITLSIPKPVLQKAKLMAVKQEKSLSALISETLIKMVEEEGLYEQAFERQKKLMEQGLEYLISDTPFDRDSLHER